MNHYNEHIRKCISDHLGTVNEETIIGLIDAFKECIGHHYALDSARAYESFYSWMLFVTRHGSDNMDKVKQEIQGRLRLVLLPPEIHSGNVVKINFGNN